MLAAVFLLLSAMASLLLGAAKLTLPQLWQAVVSGPDSPLGAIFWYARLPRTAACLLAGAALAVSGAMIQGVLGNPLASPGIIGVNAGAGLGVSLCCAAGAVSGWLVAGSAFSGALLAVLAVAAVSQKTAASRGTVILGGVAMNSLLGAFTEAVYILDPDAGMQAVDFRVGGFSAVAFPRLIPAGVLILLGLILAFTLTNELDVISLGDGTAQGLGLSVKTVRTVFLLLAALLAGAAVSFSGLLGFVGLIVPHMARKLVGGESARLIPLCAVGGGAFVTACDLAARLLFSPYELPVGLLLAVVGGPFFFWLLLRRKEGAE